METIPTETKAVSAEKAALALFKRKLSLPDIETEMLKVDQVEMPVTHNFADGVYVRELFIPAGTIVLGKRHRFETCNILLKGELSLYMGPGLPAKKIKAPCIFNSKPFVKKLAYAHKDTIFFKCSSNTRNRLGCY